MSLDISASLAYVRDFARDVDRDLIDRYVTENELRKLLPEACLALDEVAGVLEQIEHRLYRAMQSRLSHPSRGGLCAHSIDAMDCGSCADLDLIDEWGHPMGGEA